MSGTWKLAGLRYLSGHMTRPVLVAGLVAISLLYVSLLSLSVGGATPGLEGMKEDKEIRARVTRSERSKGTFTIGVSVAVNGADGKVIDNLSADDFDVYEDSKKVPISNFVVAGHQPIHVALVIDRSGSMAEEARIEGAKRAALTFLGLMRDKVDSLGLYIFSDRTEEAAPVRLLNPARRQQTSSAIASMSPRGGTKLFRALLDALDGMESTDGRRIILAMTDGEDKDTELIPEVIQRARVDGVPLFTIGLGPEAGLGLDVLNQLAHETGGKYFDAPSADQLAGLYLSIGETLQNEYAFTYKSPNPVEDGLSRRVTVIVRHGDAGAKAVGGYSVPGLVSVHAVEKSLPDVAGPEVENRPVATSVSLVSFLIIFIPLAGLLGAGFALPYLRLIHRTDSGWSSGSWPLPMVADPTAVLEQNLPSGSLAPFATPPPLSVTPAASWPAPVASPTASGTAVASPSPISADACPVCGRENPGSTSQRHCMVCDLIY